MQTNYFRHISHLLQDASLLKKGNLKSVGTRGTQIPKEFNPKDWLSFLIHIDAELEHGLMVQYLYAAYSLGGDQIHEADHQLVRQWQEIILGIAKEEMGHFVSVQNVLKVIGAPLNFGRQDFPWDSKLYPFEFKLEPFSLESLAKYVYAESPSDWLNDTSGDNQEMKEIKEEIRGYLTQEVHGDPISVIFEEILKVIKDPELIPDYVFLPKTYPFQAKFEEWGRGYKGGARGDNMKANPKGAPDVLVKPLLSRTDAINAISEISEQGEAATSGVDVGHELSHFERFLSIYKIWRKKPASFQPSKNVAINPTISDSVDDPYFSPADGQISTQERDLITNPIAQEWANLFNVRYRMLLMFLKHSFLLDHGFNQSGSFSPRGTIIHATFGEMYNLRSLANVLVNTPIAIDSDKMAGPPFLIPYTMDLPTGEENRWKVHQDLLDASEVLIQSLFKIADPSTFKYLHSLREADSKLYELAEKITGVTA